MSVKSQFGSVAAAALFWALSVYLVLWTPLLKPFYEFHRSSKLLLFCIAYACLCLVYAAFQSVFLRLKLRETLKLVLVCGAAVSLLLLLFELSPVMLAELDDNRLFHLYFLWISNIISVAYPLLSGYILYGASKSILDRAPSLCIFFLPISLVSAYLEVSYLLPALLAALLFAVLKRLPIRPDIARSLYQVLKRLGRVVRLLSRNDRSFAAFIFIVALLPRAVYAVRVADAEATGGFIWGDSIIYEKGAFDLSYEGYSLFLRTIYSIFGHSYAAVGLIQSVMGALTCVLVFRIANIIFDGSVARLAGLISVVYGSQLLLPAMHARETLLTFGLIVTIYGSFLLFKKKSIYADITIGIAMGLLSLVKVIVFPVVLFLSLYRRRVTQVRLRNLLAMVLIALAVLLTKPLVNRPLDVPVGKGTLKYTAFAYFAGNHPLSREEEWFELSRDDYQKLRAMGFNVSDRAGTPSAIREWEELYAGIAYCDKITFETNTWKLIAYNFTHPGRMLESHLNNFFAFFLGLFQHHKVFDPIFLLNRSAFSMLFRIFWLIVFALGLRWAFQQTMDRARRERLILISLVIGYFALVHTLIIGSPIYSIPIDPYMIILQSFGFRELYKSFFAR